MTHLMAPAQRGPGPPCSCGLPHFYTSQACNGQDVWTALTAHLGEHILSCSSYPQATCTCTTWASLACSTSGALQTPWLCKHALQKTPEADSSCFAQAAQTVLLHIAVSKRQIQDHLHATGRLELGKLDQAVVHGLEGRQRYVGWDVSSSLKHRW